MAAVAALRQTFLGRVPQLAEVLHLVLLAKLVARGATPDSHLLQLILGAPEIMGILGAPDPPEVLETLVPHRQH